MNLNREVLVMSVLDNFGTWKEYLKNKLDDAQQAGMNEETITNVAHQVGDYLNERVDPKNEEQRVLQELWSAANEEEQQAIANTMIKLVQKH